MKSRLALATTLGLAFAPIADARDEAALRACLAANLPAKSLAEEIVLIQTDRAGAQTRLAGSWYWRREANGQSATLRLSAPADLAGASYLFRSAQNAQDEVYMFLPAVNKVRHVSGATAAQSLFGISLSAFDLKFLFSGLRGGRLSKLGATLSEGRSAERWRYLPPSDPEILYDRIDVTIDDAWCLPLKAELFGGVPWKTLSLDATTVRQIEGRWQVGQATLADLRQGTTTLIRIQNQKIDADLPAALFQPRQFYRVRREQPP